jgi:hypothetical protein
VEVAEAVDVAHSDLFRDRVAMDDMYYPCWANVSLLKLSVAMNKPSQRNVSSQVNSQNVEIRLTSFSGRISAVAAHKAPTQLQLWCRVVTLTDVQGFAVYNKDCRSGHCVGTNARESASAKEVRSEGTINVQQGDSSKRQSSISRWDQRDHKHSASAHWLTFEADIFQFSFLGSYFDFTFQFSIKYPFNVNQKADRVGTKSGNPVSKFAIKQVCPHLHVSSTSHHDRLSSDVREQGANSRQDGTRSLRRSTRSSKRNVWERLRAGVGINLWPAWDAQCDLLPVGCGDESALLLGGSQAG